MKSPHDVLDKHQSSAAKVSTKPLLLIGYSRAPKRRGMWRNCPTVRGSPMKSTLGTRRSSTVTEVSLTKFFTLTHFSGAY